MNKKTEEENSIKFHCWSTSSYGIVATIAGPPYLLLLAIALDTVDTLATLGKLFYLYDGICRRPYLINAPSITSIFKFIAYYAPKE